MTDEEHALAEPQLPRPLEIEAYLNRFVYGQERAKRDLAVAVYNHYLSQAHRDVEGHDLGRHHILMMGPTGTGKTHLIRTLAEFLDVPVGFASATSLVETGYRGDPVDSVVRTLLDRAGGDPKKAERGMVFIDEIDKIRRMDTGGTRDVSGEGVQNGLLTLMDGRGASGSDSSAHPEVDTRRILFVCTGAFVGLDELVEQRLGQQQGVIGFRFREEEQQQQRNEQPVYAALCQAETADLVRFGMIPEFIGRFATVTVLHELSSEALAGIMTESEASALKAHQTMARVHGITLTLDDGALAAIAEEAEKLGTGARSLNRLISRLLDAVDYRWAELADDGVCEVRYDRTCVEQAGEPELIKGAVGEREDAVLRKGALRGLPRRPQPVVETASDLPPGITDVRGWLDEDIWNRLENIKRESLDWDDTTGSARDWWEAFENENKHRPALVLRLAEELAQRNASITEFFLSYVYSNTDNIQANLHYLDYTRLKKGDED